MLTAEVVFPAENQPGVAASKGKNILSNDLISAKFSKKGFAVKSGGKTLAKSTELFSIKLANGEVISSGQMQGSIKKVALKGNPKAFKLSEQFDGQALEGKFTQGALMVEWRAVLRNGSHYIRQELKISAKKCTLALRNSSAKGKTLKTTLRRVLDVPAFVQGAIMLKPAFSGQRTLNGISGKAIPLDKEISFTLKPFEVFVFDGRPVAN